MVSDKILNLLARHKLVAVITASLMLLVSVALYSSLPAEMSVHWNASGEADSTASKNIAVLILPTITLVMSALFEFTVSDKRELVVGSLSMILLLVIHVMSLLVNIGYNIPIVPISLVLAGLLVAVSFWFTKES